MTVELTSRGYDVIDKLREEFKDTVDAIKRNSDERDENEHFEDMIYAISDYFDYLKIFGYAT